MAGRFSGLSGPRRGILSIARRVVLLGLLAAVAACDAGGFDPEGWRAETGNYDRDSRRAAMLSDLLDTRLKAGTRRDDVLALLGAPDAVSGDTLIYYLGRSGYGVDLETLEIGFDGEGRLVGAAMKRS